MAVSPAAYAWDEAQADARGRSASRDALTLLAGVGEVADAAVVFLFSLIAFALRNGLEHLPLYIMTTSALASLLMANALSLAGAHTRRLNDSFVAKVGLATQAWSVVFVLLLAIFYLTKTSSEYSRLWAILWYVSVVLGLASVRVAMSVQLRRWRARGRLASTIAIVDLANGGATLARKLTRSQPDVRLLGVFTADGSGGSSVSDLCALSRLFRIDEVFVLVSGETAALEPLALILRRLGTIPTDVRVCPLLPGIDDIPVRSTSLIYNLPMLTVHRRPLDAWSSLIKRAEDLIVGSVGLALISPLMVLIAIAIKLDSPGPVLFRQARQGFNHNVFKVLKFRTMVDQASQDLTVVQAKRDDDRITRVGRILRRTSLDELPQLVNVLRGEMALVGPRPHAVVHNEQYSAMIDDYLGRHRVQPGITGWAQINGFRGETDTVEKMQRRVEYDLAYIDNWSIMLDLRIIALTAIKLLFDRGAY